MSNNNNNLNLNMQTGRLKKSKCICQHQLIFLNIILVSLSVTDELFAVSTRL